MANKKLGKPPSANTKKLLSVANSGKPWSDARRAAEAKQPLPNGYVVKDGLITTNKECSSWLGCHIGERVLSNLFNDVQVMPPQNHGYDIICNRGKLIDIKSSATGDKRGYWQFAINHNTTADEFVLIAFDSREKLNIVHLWLIPGRLVNHLTSMRIYKTTIDKWTDYELPIDKAIIYCDQLKGGRI
jgi:hypothetical protein